MVEKPMLFLDYLRGTDTYKQLCAVHDSNEGNTLEIIDERTAEAQIEFHRWALSLAMVADFGGKFLEIGHNKGMWALLVSHLYRTAYIDAIDENPLSAKVAEIVMADSDVFINFIKGRSCEVFPVSGKYNYAWVDGGHDFDTALCDLDQCDRLKIPWVAVDDTAYDSVSNAVAAWLSKAPYEEIPNPFIAADARQARLYRRHQS
jgi:hypothetical protein